MEATPLTYNYLRLVFNIYPFLYRKYVRNDKPHKGKEGIRGFNQKILTTILVVRIQKDAGLETRSTKTARP